MLEICGINDKEKNTFSKTIYCATENDMDYSCTNCLDCLRDYSPDINKLITDAENSNESSFISHSVTGSVYAIPTYCVQGYIRWTDSSGHIHPARNVSVEIRGANSSTSTSWLLTTVTTNDSGFYTANITSNSYGDDVFIRVKSKGLNITVKNPTGAEYQYNSGIHYGLTDGDIANISYTADNTYDLGKSMGVHQAMELANRYMFSLENAYMSNINVSYPDDSEGTTCYKKSENKIYVLSEDAFDWDVLEHEYGHYVQDYFNIENSPGGYHSSDENIADNSRNKSKGVYLAWGEGWATYFAINLQNKMNAVSFGIPNVGDDLYQDTVDATINYSIENLPVSKRLGESNEATVAAVLYDITDPVNTVEGDYIYCNDGNIWNIIKNNNCTSLSQFINCFYNSSFLMRVRLSLGSTLSNYKVAAYQTTSLTTGVPSFTWVKQGGSIYYPNNSFSLAFYNSSYELIARVDCGNTTTKTLTLTQWNTIKSGESTIYCCIETKQTSIPSTGAYYSNLIVISIP